MCDAFKRVQTNTDQHTIYEMSDSFFDKSDMPELNHNLNIDSNCQEHLTGVMLTTIGDVLLREKTQLITVFGEINPCLWCIDRLGAEHSDSAYEGWLRSFDYSMTER